MRSIIITMILSFGLVPGILLADVDLSISATGTTPQEISDTVIYTYVIENVAGPEDATGVIFSTALPSGLIFASISSPEGSCSPGDTIICTIPAIVVGDTATIQLEATLEDFGSYTHTALVGSDQIESDPDNNSVEISTSLSDTRLESASASGISSTLLLLFVVIRLTLSGKLRQNLFSK